MTILERIAKGSAVILIASIGVVILEYGYQAAMAHFLSPNTFGVLSVSLSVFWIALTILTSGVGISMAKFIAEGRKEEQVANYLLKEYNF